MAIKRAQSITVWSALFILTGAVAFGQSTVGTATANNAETLTLLANTYADGNSPSGYQKAMDLYTQATQVDYAPAWFGLGAMYEQGHGVAVSQAQAFQCYLKAANEGYVPAAYNVGNMYATGTGVAVDSIQSLIWLRKAADAGMAKAQYNLGLDYETGRNTYKDEAKAQTYYRAAATRGHLKAMYNLALMLEDGRGSNADPIAAAELYRAAGLKGFGPAQANLGILLASNRIGKPQISQAYAWLALAKEQGVAANALGMLANQLTPDQIAAGQTATIELRHEVSGVQSLATTQVAPLPPQAPLASLPDNTKFTAQVAELNRQLAEEKTALANAQASVQTSADKEMQGKLESLQQRLANASQSQSQLQEAQAAKDNALREAQAQLETLKSENSALTALVSKSQRQVAADRDLSLQLEQAQNENARLQQDYGAQLAVVRQKLALATASVAPGDATRLKQEQELQQDLQTTRASLAAALAAQHNRADTAAIRTEAARLEIHTLQQQVDQATAQSIADHATFAQAQARLQQIVASIQSQNTALMQQLKQAQADGSALAVHLAKEQATTAQLQASATVLTAQLQSAKEVNSLTEKKLQRVTTDYSQLALAKQQSEQSWDLERAKRTSDIADLVAELRQAKTEASSQISSLNKQLVASAELVRTAQTTIRQLQAALSDAQTKTTQLSTKLNETLSRLETSEDTAATLEHRLTTVQTESAKALQQQVATMAQLKQAAQIAETRLHIAEDTLNQIAAATPVPVGTTKWRNYTTQTGDTLASISQRFYGTPDRWVDVYAMNRSLLQDQTTLVAGLKLRIP